MRRGRLFAFSRFFVRRYIGRWQADVPERQGPAVYVCSHTNLLGPLAALCCLVPSQPAFEGILALSAGDRGTALHNSGILLLHGLAWFALYGAIALRRKRSG